MPFGKIRNAFNKVRNAVTGGSSGSPANTPNAATSVDNPSPGDPELTALLESARIIESLVSLFGGNQENNRLEVSEDASPSSKFDNVLKTSNLLATQSQFIDSTTTPINGLYGIVLRSGNASGISTSDADGNTTVENLRDIGNSVWGSVLGTALGVYEAFDADEPALSLDVLKFPEYYVFIFANTSPTSPIPILLQRDDVLEYENIALYSKAVITNKAIRDLDSLEPGTLIRVEYDAVDNKNTPVIVEIVEDKPEFTRMVVNSMKNRSALLSTIQCSTDSELGSITHPTGDPIGTEGDVLVKRDLGNNNSIAYPYRESSSVNLVVALHGVTPYNNKTGQDTILQIVQNLPVRSTLFLIPRGTSTGDFEWDDIESAINDLTSQGITITSKRLLAWSGGVKGFKKAVDGATAAYWDAGLYLADPSADTGTFGANFVDLPSGIYMEYNPNNWGGSPALDALRANFPSMAQKVTETGGQAIPKKNPPTSHTAILQSLLEQLNS